MLGAALIGICSTALVLSVLEFCGSSNPSQTHLPPQRPRANTSLEYAAAHAFTLVVKEDPTGSQNWASPFGGVWDYIYYVRDPGVGVSRTEELTDDDKVEEMLDELASKGKNVVNITVMRSDALTPTDLNRGIIYEERVPLYELGVPYLYDIDTCRFLFPSPVKAQPQPVEVMHTPEFVVDNGEDMHEYFMDIDEEQEQIEQRMEENMNKEIEKFKSNKKRKEKYKPTKRKLPELLAKDCIGSHTDTEVLADEDIISRLVGVKWHRDDPLNHFEGDTDVEELYELDDDEGVDEDQIIQVDLYPSCDEKSNLGGLSQEDNDGAQPPAFKIPGGSKSRAKKKKQRVWYDEKRENPQEQFVKKLCFLDVSQFRRALLTFHVSHKKIVPFRGTIPIGLL
ncbi:RNA-dependent RNA polymerase 1 [Hordeum vulgare]|nr:RNA-dependent RNA polymerase 1 [Hordeum vulgare]